MIEKKITQLEALVLALESEDIQLDTAIKQYAKALHLSSELVDLLKKTEDSITVLQKEGESLLSSLKKSSHDTPE